MGSFDSICAVSRLPISAGERVKLLLLGSNPYEVNSWVQRSWPVDCVYDDYGSVEDYDETCLSVMTMLECFKIDVLDKGVGDNQVHDVAVNKEGNFDQFLTAIDENRLEVLQNVDRLEANLQLGIQFDNQRFVDIMRSNRTRMFAPNDAPDNYPTLSSVVDLLESAGFGVASSFQYGKRDFFYVDEMEPGCVRLRPVLSIFEEEQQDLVRLVDVLSKKYAAVITVSKDDSRECMVLAFPKHTSSKEVTCYSWGNKDIQKTGTVGKVMILERVWDQMLEVPAVRDYEKPIDNTAIRQIVRKKWDRELEDRNILSWISSSTEEDEDEMFVRHHMSVGSVCCVGLELHWRSAISLARKNQLPREKIDKFLNDVADAVHINMHLRTLGYSLQPQKPIGPQCGDRAHHARILKIFQRSCKKNKKS